MTFLYLASPYTNPDDPTDTLYCAERFTEACVATVKLMNQGHKVFSPIVHSHSLAAFMHPSLRCSHDFWLKQDFALLTMADRLIVLQLHQWKRSYGVAQEIAFARDHGIPVEYLDPEKL